MGLYNKKVKPFENEDDVYKAKADELYGKYSDLRERLSDGFEDSVQKNMSELTGFGTAMKDIVGGLLVGTVENVAFMGATQIYLHSKPFGVTPDWVSGFVEHQVRKKVDTLAGMRDLLMDPTILADGMVKGVSDVYEDEGIAYCIGYVKGTVVSNYLTSAGVNALVEASTPKVKYTADDLKQLAEYERFLEHGSTAGLTPEELAGLEKVDAQLALKNVDYDDLLELRKNIGAGEAAIPKLGDQNFIEPLKNNLKIPPTVQSRINVANGPTRFTPLRPKTGQPVSAGFKHVLKGHFNRPLANSRSIFSIVPDELKMLLQSEVVVASPVKAISGGQFVRVVDTGQVIGNTALKFGGNETTWIEIFTDQSGNLITTYPVPAPK